MSITKEQAIEIYNNLPFDLQYYIDKKEKRADLHQRLLAAQKNLEDNFIRTVEFNSYYDWDFRDQYETKKGPGVCKSLQTEAIFVFTQSEIFCIRNIYALKVKTLHDLTLGVEESFV